MAFGELDASAGIFDVRVVDELPLWERNNGATGVRVPVPGGYTKVACSAGLPARLVEPESPIVNFGAKPRLAQLAT